MTLFGFSVAMSLSSVELRVLLVILGATCQYHHCDGCYIVVAVLRPRIGQPRSGPASKMEGACSWLRALQEPRLVTCELQPFWLQKSATLTSRDLGQSATQARRCSGSLKITYFLGSKPKRGA